MAEFDGLKTGRAHPFVVLKLEDVEFTIVDAAGRPLEKWWYVLVAPDDKKHEGQLDSRGHGKVAKVPKGECTLTVTQDPPPKAKSPPPPPAPPPPPGGKPTMTEGRAAKLRRKKIADALKELK